MPKSYRIRTQPGVDKSIQIKLEQDFEYLEILSLKINQNDIYTRQCSDYGVIVGRVLTNGGFGLPNAKVSVFIPISEEDKLNPVISELYPYESLEDLNEDGYRYNLLPYKPSYTGHASTGTFPDRNDVLTNSSLIEVYDKYYKFTVKTNDSGDYMIFGVPTGEQTIVMDVDLSDIGCFSLSPQDLIRSGVAVESQVNGNKFKSSSNLRELPQIVTLNKTVEVSPLWGEPEICLLGISRVDFDLTASANINIQPTSVFMGSIISTTEDDALKTTCKPKNNTGNLCELVSGPGQILAIRQTINTDENGLPILEEYVLEEDGKVIDANGTWLINVPMNLDYITTNEFGEQIISNDPKNGIPTKGKYRFKVKWQNENGIQNEFLRANFLVPNVKEHGWTTSSTDPFNPSLTSNINITIPVGNTSSSVITITQDGGLVFEDKVNNIQFSVLLNGSEYYGDITSIEVSNGDTIQILGNAVDITQPQTISFSLLQSGYFDVLRSYAFSLDWDDYADILDAIDCNDTFYLFNYNKVYTTAMFLDRYKNGVSRARHLGIKEIDNRSCKSTVNTFPVNDIVRNFDFLFFLFNLLINILTYPILVLLFVAHFIAFAWPVLKYLMIALGIYFGYQAVREGIDLANSIIELTAVAIPGGPIINLGVILRIAAQTLGVIFKLGLSIAFIAFTIKYLIKITNFPRIGLPMLSYPECTTCDCDCGNAEIDDDIDDNSVNNSITEAGSSASGKSIPGVPLKVATSNSFLAPINMPGTYDVVTPNYTNIKDVDGIIDIKNNSDGPYYCGVSTSQFKSLSNRLAEGEITDGVVNQAYLDYQRIFSGYESLDSGDFYKLHSPQPFLFAAEKSVGNDERWFAYPTKETYPQKLNEFNTRDKYFDGSNRVKINVVHPSVINPSYEDQVLVVLAKSGTLSNLGVGQLITFQDPTISNCQLNLTGATLNQFGNNAITGTTNINNNLSIPISYADPSNPSNTINTSINIVQTSDIGYLKYPTDIEYFQIITGFTYNSFTANTNYNLSNASQFPKKYLNHEIEYRRPDQCDPGNSSSYVDENAGAAIHSITNYQELEIIVFVRGVDPHTDKQTIKYDLSRIFGNTSYLNNSNVVVEGEYYLNVPIKGVGVTPKPHYNIGSNDNNIGDLYFPSYTFTLDSSMYSAYTSTLPYYYLSTDDTNLNSVWLGGLTYYPANGWLSVGNLSNGVNLTVNNYTLPRAQSDYIAGGTFIGGNDNAPSYTFKTTVSGNQDDQKSKYGTPPNGNYSLYSPAYIKYQGLISDISFTQSGRMIMRSDRLPTSTSLEDGAGIRTTFALHQNNNFNYYSSNGNTGFGSISIGGNFQSGESYDSNEQLSGLTSTLTCENMVSLKCYQGSGTSIEVDPNCSVPANRVKKGCYCLLNKRYIFEYGDDVALFLEWKTRFTLMFAACRGVFSQVFQNNWINGTLYMPTFNKNAIYPPNNFNDPTYVYCDDVIVFNEINNNFFYRSSPWNGTEFIGKNSPTVPTNILSLLVNNPGYNEKQIQFPTTIVDLGPRDEFISEICNNPNFKGYISNQFRSTSYKDVSDLIQMGFISRLLNQTIIQQMLPISTGGNNSEGKGVIQFFNSNRGGDRIDGDFAQALSINSEFKVTPYLSDNYPNNFLFIGDDGQGSKPRPVFGVFYSSTTEEYVVRRRYTPGYETYSLSPLIVDPFGYPSTQEVPFYRWKMATSTNIFGSENNNWDTNVIGGNGFYKQKYQSLDYNTDPFFKTSTSNPAFGFITNFDNSGNPDPSNSGVVNGLPSTPIIVGAPGHFYFGLNVGETALNRFIKIYIDTKEN